MNADGVGGDDDDLLRARHGRLLGGLGQNLSRRAQPDLIEDMLGVAWLDAETMFAAAREGDRLGRILGQGT